MERDKEAYWLVQLSQTFDFAPETFVLAISIMDRVSTLVMVSICHRPDRVPNPVPVSETRTNFVEFLHVLTKS